MEQKNNNKKLYWGIGILAALILAFLAIFFVFRAKPVEGEKNITIEVIDKQSASVVYEVNTDAEFLLGAMEDAEGLEFSGKDGDYGLMVEVINGVSAVYEKDKAFWGFSVNGEFCQYGVDQQPVVDGDKFEIKYTPAE